MNSKKEKRKAKTFKLLPSVIELIDRKAYEEHRTQGQYIEVLVLKDSKP